MRCSKAITAGVCGIAVARLLGLAASGQSTSAVATNSFPVVLDGGSAGVPSNLHGTIIVSNDRVVFEAFPEVENVTISCKAIKTAAFARRNAQILKIVSSHTTYRFDLLGHPQAEQCLSAVMSTCESLAKH
jgi:hypothetical protein